MRAYRMRDSYKEKHKLAAKKWNKENPEKVKAYQSNWKKKNPEKIKEYSKKWYLQNRVSLKEYALQKWKGNKAGMLEYRKELFKKRRLECINFYGGKCACCGESEIKFLSIDHINGGGTKHRKEVGNIPEWLIKNNFPKGFQVLCHNCNQAKGFYGVCPHKVS